MQPFWPPVEPLQSINLRAALFRCLDQAKKKGTLGRDTVLRKTMLDECKGERLEEVLAVFSTAVLKKLVREEHNPYGQPIALQLATENFSYTGERTLLSILNLAHRGVINKELCQKQVVRAQLEDFRELLDLKERKIVRRQEQLKELASTRADENSIGPEESELLSAKVQKNWSGNNEWLQTILHGDGRFEKYGMLTQPFDEVWKRVATSSVTEIEDGKKIGFINQLDARVEQQNHRLAKWQNFRKEFSKGANAEKSPSKILSQQHQKKGIDLKFGGHGALQITQKVLESTETSTFVLSEEYNQLIAKVGNDLAQLGRKDRERSPRKPKSPFKTDGSQVVDKLDDSKIFEKSTVPDQKSPSPLAVDKADGWDSTDSDEHFEDHIKTIPYNRSEPITQSKMKSKELTAEKFEDSESIDSSEDIQMDSNQEAKEALVNAMPQLQNPISPIPAPLHRLNTDSEMMADEILLSMATASPSPTKPKSRHILSLAERTRMSMARTSRPDFDDIPDLSPTKPGISALSSRPTIKISGDTDPHADLITRTRQSMSGFAAAQKKAELDRRRSVKAATKKSRESSYFPPPFSATAEDEEGSEGWEKADRVGLIEGNVDADYESVFKSRPKIALSPAISPNISPTKWDMEEEGLEEFEEESSPLRRLGR